MKKPAACLEAAGEVRNRRNQKDFPQNWAAFVLVKNDAAIAGFVAQM